MRCRHSSFYCRPESWGNLSVSACEYSALIKLNNLEVIEKSESDAGRIEEAFSDVVNANLNLPVWGWCGHFLG